MFETMKTKRKIKSLRKQIKYWESKRVRSQAALVEAILKNTTPDDADVDYFNKYTEKIDALRDIMKEYELKLDK